jgi:hypothetical protein
MFLITLYKNIQDRYKVWQQLNISRMVSPKFLRFGKELRAFKFYSFQYFQFYTFICFRDTRITLFFLMATGVNFMIFEKRFFFWIQRCITCNNILHKNGQKKIFNFKSKINKQLSLKTISIINLFIYCKNALFKWNRADRSSNDDWIWW